MGSQRRRFVPLLAIACLLYVPCLSPAQTAHRSPKQQARPQIPQQEEAPAPAPVLLPPATLELMPARPPVVTLRGGELTIVAQNSTLADILEAVSRQTGATIDIPQGADERVVAHLGPGPVRDVLDSLLMGSKFNYVMLGSEADSIALTQIMLFPKPGTETDKTAGDQAVQARGMMPAGGRLSVQQQRVQAAIQPQPAAQPQETAETSEEQETTPPENKTAAEQARPAAPVSEPPAQDAAKTEPPAPPPAEEHHGTPNIRSMQEVLQQMYSQRRQMIEQQQQPQQQQTPPQQQ